MGKSYRKELDLLPEIYEQARKADFQIVSDFISKYGEKTFFAIGSGGSYSVAKIFEYMSTVAGITCKSVTPLELSYYNEQLRDKAAILFTAGGSNHDSRNAYTYASNHEMEGVLTCCMKKNSAIMKMQRDNLHNFFYEYVMPVAKDGYLAVESLISFLTILANAFEKATKNEFFVISNETDWLNSSIDFRVLDQVLNKNSIIVLHGGITTPAAIDLESKFSETSLGNIQLVDFRNFAHGRHFWLSDRKDSTGIISLVSFREKKIADRTLQIVPHEIPCFRVDINDSSIMGLFETFKIIFEIVYQAGMIRGIDPGKPKVPDFGKKMYHINYNPSKTKRDIVYYAAERKKSVGMSDNITDCIRQGCHSYEIIQNSKFRGIVFDYDGTLHDKRKVTKTETDIYLKINELLKAGVKIGIATGRGKSVRTELQKVIDQNYWEDVVIAYYNGGCIGTLADNNQPNKNSKSVPDGFKEIENFININYPQNINMVDGISDHNPFQLTIINRSDLEGRTFFESIREYARDIQNIKVLESSHSIDIIPCSSSKNNIFSYNRWREYNENEFIRFGDAGHFGGNDYELLKSAYGVSVDSISSSPWCCWNFAKQGMRNLEATLYYVSEKLIVTEEGLVWR